MGGNEGTLIGKKVEISIHRVLNEVVRKRWDSGENEITEPNISEVKNSKQSQASYFCVVWRSCRKI